LGAALALIPAEAAHADDPLKDLLGKAQRSQQKAVEDLIGKLEGKAKPAAPAGPAAPEAVAVTPPQPPADAKAPDPKAADAKTGTGAAREAEPAAKADAKPDSPSSPGTVAKPATVEPQAPSGKIATPVEPAPKSPPPASQPAETPPSKTAKEVPAVPEPDRAPAAQVAEAALPSVDLDIYFDFNSAAITPRAAETLAPLGRALNDPRLAGAIFLIAGHTDAKGNPAVNQQMSVARAEAVRQYLATTFGIAPSRLIARGFGQARLKDRDNPQGEANRRVQIVNVTAYARN
jgi:outer membrane protein OmpA-like peptidoglycan-associated protein